MAGIIDEIKKKNFPLITAVIIAVNVIVFIILEFMGSTEDADFILGHGGLSFENVVYFKEYYRLITHFFIHFGYEHLIFNMFVLAMLGRYLENIMGRWIFLFNYFLSGVFAGAVSVIWNYYRDGSVVSAGASGAIYGVIGALAVLIVINRGRVQNVGPLQFAIFIVLTLFCSYGDKQTDNAAHIAGFVFGAVFMAVVSAFQKKKTE